MVKRSAVAIYARISQDRTGEELGVQRQLKDCRAEAHRLGWTVAEEYVDDDVSAYNPRKKRPEYARMLADIADGLRDGVIVYHLDRLQRRQIELEQFVEVCSRAGLKDLHTVQGEFDLGSGDGLLQARILGAFAAHESDTKSRRLKRKALETAQAGKPHSGGNHRPFGFLPDRITHNEAEAAIVRQLAGRILAGESLSSVTNWLDDSGVRTVSGRPWVTTTVRQILTNPRYWGMRTHHGDATVKAVWDPIITPSDGERLRQLLLDPARRTNRTARRYLLSGMLRCSKCGATLVSYPKSNGVRTYRCAKRPGIDACGGTQIVARQLEEWITEAVTFRLDSPALAKARTPGPDATAEHTQLAATLKRVSEKREELAVMYATDGLSRQEWNAARSRLDTDERTARRRLAQITQRTAVDPYIGHGNELRTEWATINLSRQAAIVKAVMNSATVLPVRVRGRRGFDHDRVRPDWRL